MLRSSHAADAAVQPCLMCAGRTRVAAIVPAGDLTGRDVLLRRPAIVSYRASSGCESGLPAVQGTGLVAGGARSGRPSPSTVIGFSGIRPPQQ